MVQFAPPTCPAMGQTEPLPMAVFTVNLRKKYLRWESETQRNWWDRDITLLWWRSLWSWLQYEEEISKKPQTGSNIPGLPYTTVVPTFYKFTVIFHKDYCILLFNHQNPCNNSVLISTSTSMYTVYTPHLHDDLAVSFVSCDSSMPHAEWQQIYSKHYPEFMLSLKLTLCPR